MTVRIEDVHNPTVELTTNAELAEDLGHEFNEESADEPILTLSYDEVVVISGDLKKFATDVWQAVFGKPATLPAPPAQGLALDANSIRDELKHCADLSEVEADAIRAMSDTQINTWINEVVARDAVFWAGYDTARRSVINRLQALVSNGEPHA